MSESDDPQFRARITALSDLELARMLTLEADNYRVEALIVAKAEARTRRLDFEQFEDELRRKPPAPVTDRERYVLTGAWEPERIYRLHSLFAILALALGCDVALRFLDSSRELLWKDLGSLIYFAGWIEYLHALLRLNGVLRTATEGRFPTRRFELVLLYFLPCVSFVGCFVWSTRIARFGEINGNGRRTEGILPAAAWLASMVLAQVDVFAAVLVLTGSLALLHARLRRAMEQVPSREARGVGWGSSEAPKIPPSSSSSS